MHCPICQFENREGAKFCNECGYKFEINCPKCETPNRVSGKFCKECGYKLESDKETLDEILETESLSHPPSIEKPSSDGATIVGERKHVTALFSDLNGHTAMSEKFAVIEQLLRTEPSFDPLSCFKRDAVKPLERLPEKLNKHFEKIGQQNHTT